MLLLFFRFFRQRTVNGPAEAAPRFAAALAEAAVRAGVLLGDGFFLHFFIICLQGRKGKGCGSMSCHRPEGCGILTDHDSACGAVAQLGERLNGIQEVVGSIPISSTIKYQ